MEISPFLAEIHSNWQKKKENGHTLCEMEEGRETWVKDM